ncbi:hypothetical protein TIFTF001_055520, partial [Ficus carica]
SSNTNGGNSFSDDDDNDWGDFVTTRSDQIKTGFELSNGTNGESPLANSVADESAAAAPSWVKPRGALPLSLFGEAEEESGPGEPTVGDGAPIVFSKKDGDGDAKKKGSALNGGVGINDLLANLYGHNQQIKVQNGTDVNSNVSGANSNSNESGAGVDGLRSSLNESNWHENGLDSFFHDANQNSNNWDSNVSNVTRITFDSNGLSSDLVEQSENFDDEEDDDGTRGCRISRNEGGNSEKSGNSGGGRFNIEEPGPTIGFSNGAIANGPVDISFQSDDAPQSAGDWSLVFDFNQSSVTQDDFFWDSNAKSQKNDAGIGSNFSSVVE